MRITAVTENLKRFDTYPTDNANIVSKGFRIGPTCVERRIVLGQDCFGVAHNVLKRCTGKKLRSAFLPGTGFKLLPVETIDTNRLMLSSPHDLDASSKGYQCLSVRHSIQKKGADLNGIKLGIRC